VLIGALPLIGGIVLVLWGESRDLTWERVDRARGIALLDVTKSGKRREVT
jgi:hypothetical protein